MGKGSFPCCHVLTARFYHNIVRYSTVRIKLTRLERNARRCAIIPHNPASNRLAEGREP